MSDKVFVGNVCYDAQHHELEAFFAGADCPVEHIEIIRDRTTGQSRGFAFASLRPDVSVESFCEQFNDAIFRGRRLTVRPAVPRRER